MATVRFNLEGEKKSSMIYVRLRDGRKYDLKAPTGLTIDEKYWSKEKHWIKPKSAFQGQIKLENTLRRIELLVFERRNDRITRRLGLNLEWLKDVLSEATSHHAVNGEELVFLIDAYKEKLATTIKNGRNVSNGTIRNYNTTVNRLKKYEKHFCKKLVLMDLDLDFHSSYMQYARNELNLSINSVGNDFKKIKTVCIDAMHNGLEVNPLSISKKFYAPTEKTLFITLSEDDLLRIQKFSGSDCLNNARDWLLVGCWTGARVGDLMKFSNENIIDHDDKTRILRYDQSKTGKQVKVPLHPQVIEIIDRLNGFPRPISDVKFNKYIKDVCKLSGLNQLVKGTRQNPDNHRKETGMFFQWQLVKSHTCRRSFATNHYNKLPNKVIMAVTGHSTERMLLQYIGETETQHINEYLNLWS